MNDKPRLLVIDDGLDYAGIVQQQLSEFELVRPTPTAVRIAEGPAAMVFLRQHADSVDVVLLDMHFDLPPDRLLPLGDTSPSLRRTRRFQGVAILREIRRLHPQLPVVLMTAREDLSLVDMDGELAAQSMTYILGDDDLDTLRIRINAALRESAQGLEDGGVLWGSNRGMQALRRRLGVLCRGRLPVIFEGETGTGKSFVAQHFIHNNSRRDGPFVVLDLSTVPTDLIPAHLFGAARGAFTGAVTDRKGVFEIAHGGTLLIDEIQNAPLEVQKQLLLVLQDKRIRPLGSSTEVEVDVKIIAASNEPLDAAVKRGAFRQDLYMRLSPATRVRIPPLRERMADLPFLARRIVERVAREPDIDEMRRTVAEAAGLPVAAPLHLSMGRAPGPADALEISLPAPAWAHMQQHRWPGNMRELSMALQNIVAFTLVGAVDAIGQGMSVRGPRLQVDPGLVGELLGAAVVEDSGHQSGSVYEVTLSPGKSLNAVTTDVERQYYRSLFARCRGDFDRMAEVLLGDGNKGRAVRLRFNQIGLKVRDLRREKGA